MPSVLLGAKMESDHLAAKIASSLPAAEIAVEDGRCPPYREDPDS
jgi:hypothetical protein